MVERQKPGPSPKPPLVRVINAIANTIEDHPDVSRRAFVLGLLGLGGYVALRPVMRRAQSRSQVEREWRQAEVVAPLAKSVWTVDDHNVLINTVTHIELIEPTSQADWRQLQNRYSKEKREWYVFTFLFMDADKRLIYEQQLVDGTARYRLPLNEHQLDSGWTVSVPPFPADFLSFGDQQKQLYLADLEAALSANIYAVYETILTEEEPIPSSGIVISSELINTYSDKIRTGELSNLLHVHLSLIPETTP